MRGKKPYDFAWEWPTLPEDADEVLLGLLARDNEPCATHDKPHRRWVHPPSYWPERGWWEAREPDWWVFTSYAEYAEKNKANWTDEERQRDARQQEKWKKQAEEVDAELTAKEQAQWRARSEAARDMRDATARLGYRPLAARTVPVSIAKGWPGYWSLTFEVPPDASGS